MFAPLRSGRTSLTWACILRKDAALEEAELKGPRPSANEREALLQKPFTPARLLGAIENALHSTG